MEYPLYLFAKAVGLILRTLPVGLSLALGRSLGLLALYINPKRRRIAYANLKCALGNKYNIRQINRILKKSYSNLGQTIIEVFLLPKVNKRYMEKYFTFEGFQRVDQALKANRGAILLTGHFGNWEISTAALAISGYKYTAVAREQKPILINRMLNSYRQIHGCRIISKGIPIREIIKALRSNEIVGMLVDQDAGKTGILVELFGRPASWHRGVMEFSLKTGCQIIPGFAIRQKGPRINFKVHDPIVFPEEVGKEEKIKAGFEQFAKCLENAIRMYPEQWLWQHKRWKSTPQRRVLILNDGKLGHLRQSQAVFFKIQQAFKERGIASDDILLETVDVEFKGAIRKTALSLSCSLSGKSCQGCMRCLKFCLSEKAYKHLMRVYADIVISCGSATEAVNLLVARENNAKSIVIMKPPRFLINKFDLAIIPKHDNPKKRKNVVVTEGVPNLVNKQLIEYQANSLRYDLGPMKDTKIGLLLGGSNKYFNMTQKLIYPVLEGIKTAAYSLDADILATTSRRTPKSIEELFNSELGAEPRCKLSIVANEKNIEGAVGGILGLCDVVIVSPESVSMISESASSGAYVIVFKADAFLGKRNEVFLSGISNKGFIKIAEAKDIKDEIEKFLRHRPEVKILDDGPAIREGLRRII